MTNTEAQKIIRVLRDNADLFNDTADVQALDMALDALRGKEAADIIGRPVYKIRIRRPCPTKTRWGRNTSRKEWTYLAENGRQVKRFTAFGDCSFEIEERDGVKTDTLRLGDVVFLDRDDAEKRLAELLGRR